MWLNISSLVELGRAPEKAMESNMLGVGFTCLKMDLPIARVGLSVTVYSMSLSRENWLEM